MSQDKQDLLTLMYLYPDWYNIEYILELGWDGAKWKRVVRELEAEGKLSRRVKATYTACRNKDGTITTTEWIHHKKENEK